MPLKESLMQMMGDFVNMNKNPEFHSKSDISTSQELQLPSARSSARRQSLNITVGTQGPPESLIYHRHSVCPELLTVPRSHSRSKSPVKPPTESLSSRRQTEPAITLAEIRQKFRRRRSEKPTVEEDEAQTDDQKPEKKHSSEKLSIHRKTSIITEEPDEELARPAAGDDHLSDRRVHVREITT